MTESIGIRYVMLATIHSETMISKKWWIGAICFSGGAFLYIILWMSTTAGFRIEAPFVVSVVPSTVFPAALFGAVAEPYLRGEFSWKRIVLYSFVGGIATILAAIAGAVLFAAVLTIAESLRQRAIEVGLLVEFPYVVFAGILMGGLALPFGIGAALLTNRLTSAPRNKPT